MTTTARRFDLRRTRPSWRTVLAYRDSRVVAWGLLLVSCLTVWLAFWPGLISPDSNQTIYQAATSQYTNWWTPFGAWLLHWWLHLGLGLSGVFAIGVVLVVCGIYLCARFCLRRVPAALLTLVICVLPPVYGDLSGLSRDLFYLGFTFCGFGLFGRLLQGRGGSTAGRSWLAVGAVGSEIMAYLCRQNAIAGVFALMLGIALWWRLRRRGGAGPLGRREVALAIVAAVVATGAVGLGTIVGYSLAGVRAVDPQRFTYVYDLASISVLSHHDRFPASVTSEAHPGWVTPPHTREANLDQLFDPVNVITMYPNNAAGQIAFGNAAIASRENSILQSAWLKAIVADPLDYAWGRVRLIAIQLGLWRHPTDAYLPELSPNNFGYPLVFPSNYRFASRVLAHFVGPAVVWLPLDIPWTWLLLIILCVGLLLRRLRRLAWHFLLLPIAVGANYVLLLLATMAAGFRYVALEVPVALLMVAYVLAAEAVASERWRELVEPAFRTLVDQAATPARRRMVATREVERTAHAVRD
jgi:hypothetical protein